MAYIKELDGNPIYAESVHWLRKNMGDILFLDNEVPCYPSKYTEFSHKEQCDYLFRSLRKHLIEYLKLEEKEVER
jgi:hypothetical protein